jgi:hypothetical protein
MISLTQPGCVAPWPWRGQDATRTDHTAIISTELHADEALVALAVEQQQHTVLVSGI